MKKTTRVRGFADWKPTAASIEVVEQIDNVLAQYQQHLPLTLRQVFYRLVGTVGYAKTEKAYKTARREGQAGAAGGDDRHGQLA